MISWQYIAGLIDGEGCIRAHPSNKGKYRKYYPRVQITNTHTGVLIAICEQLGGAICGPKRRPDSKHDCWDWRLTGDGARNVLRETLPYLIIKKEKALEVLAKDCKVLK